MLRHPPHLLAVNGRWVQLGRLGPLAAVGEAGAGSGRQYGVPMQFGW
jgi:hypothetical protein